MLVTDDVNVELTDVVADVVCVEVDEDVIVEVAVELKVDVSDVVKVVKLQLLKEPSP